MNKRKKSAKSDIRLAVVFSDLHSGSRRALMMPEYTLYEDPNRKDGRGGNTVLANAMQLWLWECWQTAWRDVLAYIGGDDWLWVFNGDAVEGTHRLTEVVSNDLTDHQLIFKQLCEPAAELAAARIMIRGTRVHTGDTAEMKLAESLGCLKHPDTGQFAADRWMVELNGFRVLFKHHMSVTAREWSRGTALSGELANEIASGGLRNQPIPRGLCCAHRHGFDYWDGGSSFMLVSGPWQQTTRYGHVKWSSMIPAPSLSVLDWRGKPYGAAPKVENFIYEPQPATVVKL